MKISGSTYVPGRGKILLCEIEDGDLFPRIDDGVFYQGKVYLVKGIEMARTLTDPPLLKRPIGLLVSEKQLSY